MDTNTLTSILLENQSFPSCVLDPEGRVLMANGAFRRASGITLEGMRGIPTWDLPPWRHRLESSKAIEGAVARVRQMEITSIEVEHVCADGDTGWCVLTFVPVCDENDRLTHIVQDAREVTGISMIGRSDHPSEEIFRTLFDLSPDAVCIERHEDAALVDVNEAFLQASGYTREELIGRQPIDPDLRLIDDPGYDADEWRAELDEYGVIRNKPLATRRKNGEHFPVQVSVRLVTLDDVQYRVIVVRDVTELARAEQKLRESEAKFRTLFELLPDPVYIERFEGSILQDVNDAYSQLTGYPREEIIGRSMTDPEWGLLDDPDFEVEALEEQLLAEGTLINAPLRIRRKNGEHRRLLLTERLIMLGGEKRRIGSARDVTDFLRAEQRLKESEHRYHTLFEHLYDAVFLLKGDRFVDCNEKAIEMYAYPREDILDRTPFDLSPRQQPDGSDSREKAQALIESALRGEIDTFEWVHARGNGELFSVEVRLIRVALRSGPHLLAVVRDVTEQRSVERERERLSRQVEASRGRLARLSRQLLDSQEQERRRIASELHDEIGANLTTVKIGLQHLMKEASGERCGAWSVHLSEQLPLIDSTIDVVRNLALDLRPSILDDFGLAPAIRWYLERQLRATGLRSSIVEESVPTDLPPTTETACFRVVQEVVTNVLRHAKASTIEITVVGADRELRVTARDDGIGFDVDEARRRSAMGESFGLLGMQERIALLGGELEIRSSLGQGTEIEALFPIKTDAKASDSSNREHEIE